MTNKERPEGKKMNYTDVITAKNIKKRFGKFELNIEELHIPEGFSTALVGENGAGKTTLLNILGGLRRDNEGEVTYFKENKITDEGVMERIGFTGTKNYLLPHWNGNQVRELSEMLFDNFDGEKFDSICKSLNVDDSVFGAKAKPVSKLSDGNIMKLMLATVFARKTDLLLLDEPASPLDPLMRDMLGDILRTYIAEGNGKRSVLFSTHNISDMESVCDYIIIMDDGKILERGFVLDIKEKYVVVKGDERDYEAASKHMVSAHNGKYGFEGIALSEKKNLFAGMNVSFETPDLFQICVSLLKQNSKLQMPEL
jgi:ABC-2 type transport system ATP-binding protein